MPTKIQRFAVLIFICATGCKSPAPMPEKTETPPAGNAALQNGPMLGYADLREVLVWVQTTAAASVQVEYWDEKMPEKKFRTTPVSTEAKDGYTAKCVASPLEPGHGYAYAVYINGKAVSLPYPATFRTQPLWQWRTDPPAFDLATGSCAYINEPEYDRPGKPYGSDYQIFASIYRQKPDLMLWLGDDVYYREVDWNTRSGMIHRWTHDRATPELQPLLASTPQYAIWDDHDFGSDDSDGTFPYKETSWEVFRSFWGNPSYGVDGQKGCTTKFTYMDVDFFLLDNRYFRTPNFCATCPDRSVLGKEQLRWFLGALAASKAPFKLVAIGGQVLTTNNHHETCFHFFPAERDTILNFIERENIKGVIFLTGDRHFSELSAMQNKAGNWVYDLTTSSLTAGSYTGAAEKEANAHRVAGTVVDRHNFSILHFSGPRTKREVEIRNYDADGNPTWTKTITADGPR